MVQDTVKVESTTAVSNKDTTVQDDLLVIPLAGVDVNDAAAKLQSRGDLSADNIFEILPRFSLSAPVGKEAEWESQYVRRREMVLAATNGSDVTGIIVSSRLVVFERDVEEPLKQLQFPSQVDFLVWRRSIIIVGLSSSRISLIDPKSFCCRYTGKPLCPNRDDASKGKYFVDAFIHSNPDPTKMDVVIVSKDGLVYNFCNIALSDGTMDSTFDQNVSLDVDLGAVKEITSYDLGVESEIVCACSPSRNLLITLERFGGITIVDSDDLCSDIPSVYLRSNLFMNLNVDLKVLQVFPTKISSSEGMLFVLLSNGSLEIFGGVDLVSDQPLQLPQVNMVVYDFTLVVSKTEGNVKLWALYGDGVSNFVGIFKGPSFTPEFTFRLPSAAGGTNFKSHFKFPQNINPYEEPVSIVEMAEGCVKLYHILETSTDVTLQKLLARGLYAEAQDLAVQYKKDLDIVRKAEAKDILNRLTTKAERGGQDESLESLFLQLLEVLNQIQDAEFVCILCVQAKLPKVEWVKNMLELGKGRVSQCMGSHASTALLLTMKKFYTFQLVFPGGSIGDWNAFNAEDNTMFQQSLRFLHNGLYVQCERVWRRHSEDFVPSLTLTEFLPFFNSMFSHQLRSPESCSLFKTILPFSVEKVSGSQEDETPIAEDFETQELMGLVNMILRQVSTLEGDVSWPVNALNFVKVLNSLIIDEFKRLENSRTETGLWMKKKKLIVRKLNIRLDQLIQVLEELAELKRNHSIRIPFADYTENQIVEVVSKLLYKLLRKEEVESFVEKYLRPYAERKRLNVDFLFTEHIMSVLANIHFYHQAVNIPHEERIVSLISLIASSKVKLECTLRIAEEWPVPWTPGIDAMVKQILDIFPREKLNSECVRLYDSIYLMRKQVPYRCVLRKYRLNGVMLGQSKCYVTMALLRILKLKKEGYKEDCKELLRNIPGETHSDEVRLEYLDFSSKLNDETADWNEIITSEILQKESLKKAASMRTLVELQQVEDCNVENFYSAEEKQRLINIYSILVANSKDPKIIMSAKLKQFLDLIPLNSVYREDFPFAVLNPVLDAAGFYPNNPEKLFEDCKTISRITGSYLPDLLMAAATVFIQEEFPGNRMTMIWPIVELIVASPIPLDQSNSSSNRDLLQYGGFNLAKFLMLQCPSLSLEQMETLQEFLCRLLDFDEISEEVSKLLTFYRIFLSLKEQEVPLELEFLEVYEWLAGVQKPLALILEKLKTIGDVLLKFGEDEIFNSTFTSIKCHLTQVVHTYGKGTVTASSYMKLIQQIDVLTDELRNRRPPVEKDRILDKLVKHLNESGIRVNQYALKLRNKEKLLEKLLNQKNYILASDLAIAFRVFDEGVWSRILQGFISSEEREDLRLVLKSICTITKLWMLPEFADAWKKVAEMDESFLGECPIPL